MRNKINANFCLFAPILCPCLRIYVLQHVFLHSRKNLKWGHSKAEKEALKIKSGVLFFSSKKCTFGTPQTRAQCPKKCVRKLKKRVRFWAHYWGAAYRESVKHQVPKSDVLKKCFLGNSHKYGWNLVKNAQKKWLQEKNAAANYVFCYFFSFLCSFWSSAVLVFACFELKHKH